MVISLEEFPEVDEETIDGIGRTYAAAAGEFDGLLTVVDQVASSGSWTTPAARPPYDASLRAREGDPRIAREAMEHISDVLQMTSRELETSREQYNSARYQALYVVGNPYLTSSTGVGGLVDPGPEGAAPDQIAEYEGWVRLANDATSDANYILALCANELLGVSVPLAFPEPLNSAETPSAIGFHGVIVPIGPAWGAPAGAIFAGGVPPPQFARGRAFEAKVLRELGISGEAKRLWRADAKGDYDLPRTKSGYLYRGTFPDSIKAGVLEVKSGKTEIKATDPQIQVLRWLARQLGVRFNLVVGPETRIDPELLEGIRDDRGSISRRIPGRAPVYWDELNNRAVRATGGRGFRGDELRRVPLTQEEIDGLPRKARDWIEKKRGGGGDDPPGGATGAGGGAGTLSPGGAGPSTPYVTGEEFYSAWDDVTVTRPPLPAMPGQPGGTGPVVPLPGIPLPGPVPLPSFPGLPGLPEFPGSPIPALP